MAIEMIQEFTDSRGIRLGVDREAGVIRGVKLLGLVSRNDRTYLKETVARAVTLYEGAKVNVDHAGPDSTPAGPRSYSDRMGVVRNVHLDQGDGGLRADFHANPKHALFEQLAWDAQHSPESVGFSHNIMGKTSKRDGRTVVEEITRVTSVDLVADPATTRGLFEQLQVSDDREEVTQVTQEMQTATAASLQMQTATAASLRVDFPGQVDQIIREALEEQANSEEAKAKDALIKEQAETIDRFEVQEALEVKRRAIDAAIKEAKLPDPLVTDVFRKSLMEAKDAGELTALIEDRLSVAKPTGQTPTSKEQTSEESTPYKTVSAEDFLAEAQRPEGGSFDV